MVPTDENGLLPRRDLLQLLALVPVAACAAEAKPGGTAADAAADAVAVADAAAGADTVADTAVVEVAPEPCVKVGAGAKISLGPISGGSTSNSVRLAVRLDGAAKVQFRLQVAGGTAAPIDSGCAMAKEAQDFAVVVDAAGLAPNTEYLVTPLIDDVAAPDRAITTRTFAKAGETVPFTFVFGSCCRYSDDGKATHCDGKTLAQVAKLDEKPWFFAQIGDWTYPDYAFVPMVGKDKDGNNYTVYPAELTKSWHRRLTDKYPIRQVLAAMPLAYVWDDHDFAENNSHKDVTGKQSDRMAAFRRYVPDFGLPARNAGTWQKFSAAHCDFFLVDMRSQRTDVKKAIIQTTKTDGSTGYAFAEPPGHTLLGAEQLQWLIDGLKASKAQWKFVFMPVEINPRYDPLLLKGLDLAMPLLIEAIGDSWTGYPTERKKILDLHTSGQVKNIVFLTGDAHMAAMAPRDATCPPIFMAANLDIDQAPIIDLLEQYGYDRKTIWPEWSQTSADENTIGRVRIVTAPKPQVIFESWGQNGALLHSLTVDATP